MRSLKENQSDVNSKSLKGNIWQEITYDEAVLEHLKKEHDFNEVIAKILASRIASVEEIDKFVNPTLKSNLIDPFHLIDMEKGANDLADAIIAKKKIVIFGDYDVDGATSSAIFKRFLQNIGHDCEIYIPDRIIEGYGPNCEAFKKLKEDGAELVITVDCGTTAFEPMEEAHKLGLDVIIIDHHQSIEDKPEALAIINPNRDDENSPYTYLAAAGVSFLMVVAVNKILRERGYYKEKKEPDLFELLDLVALGTVCDVVPLVGLNRAFVAVGLKVMAKGLNPGIKALREVAALDDNNLSPYHLGFVIGPRINAGGRVGESFLGSQILTENDPLKVKHLAAKLNLHNQERKAIEEQVIVEALNKIEEQQLDKRSLIIVAGKNWHPGVIGIAAARIKEKYQMPVAVVAINDGIGKASCRSINGVDFGNAILTAREKGLLVNGGGHAMAAGFTVAEDKFEELYNFLDEQMKNEILEASQNRKLDIDYFFSISALNKELIKNISILEPFGTANREPRFVVDNCQIVYRKIIGKDHIKIILSERSGGVYGDNIEAIAWRSVGTILGDQLLTEGKNLISVAGTLGINEWNGEEKIQLTIEDIKNDY